MKHIALTPRPPAIPVEPWLVPLYHFYGQRPELRCQSCAHLVLRAATLTCNIATNPHDADPAEWRPAWAACGHHDARKEP